MALKLTVAVAREDESIAVEKITAFGSNEPKGRL
jgi:hypothetical protein